MSVPLKPVRATPMTVKRKAVEADRLSHGSDRFPRIARSQKPCAITGVALPARRLIVGGVELPAAAGTPSSTSKHVSYTSSPRPALNWFS